MLYLHGFASGPSSSKALSFVRHFADLGVEVTVPQLDEGRFEQLTISRMREIVAEHFSRLPRPHVLVGSSLGGYLSLLHASTHPVDALVLMAPAVDFERRLRDRHPPEALAEWERTGFAEVDHHALKRRAKLSSRFLLDAAKHEAYPKVGVPTLVFQGRNDEVVPLPLVSEWVAMTASASLVELEDGHELTNSIGRILDESQAFLAGIEAVSSRWPRLA